MALVAKYYGGAYTIHDLYKVKFGEVWFWNKQAEFQQFLEESVYELSHDEKGNAKAKPSNRKVRERAMEKMQTLKELRNGG